MILLIFVCCCLLFCYKFSSFFPIFFLFSRGLDLSKYVVNEDHVKPIYDLFAVSNHFGGMGRGHCKPHPQHSQKVGGRQSEGRRISGSLNRSLSVSFEEEVKAGKQRFCEKSDSQSMDMDKNRIEEEEERAGKVEEDQESEQVEEDSVSSACII